MYLSLKFRQIEAFNKTVGISPKTIYFPSKNTIKNSSNHVTIHNLSYFHIFPVEEFVKVMHSKA